MRIRPAEESDLRALAEIQVAGREWLARRYEPETLHQFPVDPDGAAFTIRHVHGTGAVFVAEDPEPVGFSSAVIRDGVWFLSQLWVAPDRHGAGIGSALLDAALAWGRGSSTFSVVASPFPGAQTVYMRRSMFPVWHSMEFEGEAPGVEMPEGADELTTGDQPWVDELDREVRGIARPEDHELFREHARGIALRRGDEPLGYLYAWPEGKLGPAAIRDGRDTPDLLRAGIAAGPSRLSLIVPTTNWAALQEAIRLRLRLVSRTVFMASRAMPDGSRYLSSGGALA
ncbi:MAG TPA: GNAT family N-acetyltransferase [Actinomycetota bacterium]